MEDLLPFVIGLAAFAYKIYSNFKSEQEKARKRDTSMPAEPIDDLYVPEKPAESRKKPVKEPAPFLLEEVVDPARPFEPKYKHIYKEAKVAAPIKEKSSTELSQYGLAVEIPAEEVLQSRKIYERHQHKLERVNHDEELPYEFDMRDAIIKQAILNRPDYL